MNPEDFTPRFTPDDVEKFIENKDDIPYEFNEFYSQINDVHYIKRYNWYFNYCEQDDRVKLKRMQMLLLLFLMLNDEDNCQSFFTNARLPKGSVYEIWTPFVIAGATLKYGKDAVLNSEILRMPWDSPEIKYDQQSKFWQTKLLNDFFNTDAPIFSIKFNSIGSAVYDPMPDLSAVQRALSEPESKPVEPGSDEYYADRSRRMRNA